MEQRQAESDECREQRAVANMCSEQQQVSLEGPNGITTTPRRPVLVDAITGHSDVTIPAKPTRKHTFSELLELDSVGPHGTIKSPSGNDLNAEQLRLREDRPASIKERQEAIKRKVAERSALSKMDGMGNDVEIVGDSVPEEVKKARKQREKANQKMERNRKLKDVLQCYCQ
jgi:hypothetical protein